MMEQTDLRVGFKESTASTFFLFSSGTFFVINSSTCSSESPRTSKIRCGFKWSSPLNGLQQSEIIIKFD